MIFINDTLFEIVSVHGPSMQPTLSPSCHETGVEDYLAINKWSPTDNLQRGDVVAFWSPQQPLTLSVKRVIGLGGDWVELDRRRRPKDKWGEIGGGRQWDLMRQANGSTLADGSSKGKRGVRVPWGHVWVEGDNWRCSRDSNYYGPVSAWS